MTAFGNTLLTLHFVQAHRANPTSAVLNSWSVFLSEITTMKQQVKTRLTILSKKIDEMLKKDPILVISFHLHFGYFSKLAVLLQYTDSEYQIKPHIWYCVSGFVCTGPPAPCGRGFTT